MVINPYTFVSLPPVPPERSDPAFHHRQQRGRFDGWMDIEITTRTPLLLGSLNDRELGQEGGHPVHEPPRRCPGDHDSPVVIPGSSLLGAFRSVHETMNNSCLRIVDEEFRPVHRYQMTEDLADEVRTTGDNDGSLRLAIVRGISSGVPTLVQVCDDVIWVEQGQFAFAPTTGDRVRLVQASFGTMVQRPNGAMVDGGKKRYTGALNSVTRAADGEWIVLVTDTAARPKKANAKVWFACGRVRDRSPKRGVRPEAQVAFARAVEGASDWTRYAGDALVPVTHPGTSRVIGHRRPATRAWENCPVWVKADWQDPAAAVDEVRLSVAWRWTSDFSVGDRIADPRRGVWSPCVLHKGLCASCRTFGSSEDAPAGGDRGRGQHSYRGHVRVDDAVAADCSVTQAFWRAPLGTPSPTAGQFYLSNRDVEGMDDSSFIPIAHWGSFADWGDDGRGRPRGIRGRKFYWRTSTSDPSIPPTTPQSSPRGRARPHQEPTTPGDPTQAQQVVVIRPGVVFRTRVSFTNLDPIQIGALVAAIQPDAVLEGADVVLSVGGGKPFGWGAIDVAVTDFQAQSASHRYLPAPAEGEVSEGPMVTAESAVKEYRTVMAGKDWWATLRAELERVLTMDAVHDSDVWYPVPGPKAAIPPRNGRPGRPAQPAPTRGTADYDKAFSFWLNTSGFDVGGSKPLKSLPAVLRPAREQHLPVFEEKGN